VFNYILFQSIEKNSEVLSKVIKRSAVNYTDNHLFAKCYSAIFQSSVLRAALLQVAQKMQFITYCKLNNPFAGLFTLHW